MDIIDICNDMNKYVTLIAEARRKLKATAQRVGDAEAEYYKKKGIVNLQLIAGKIIEFEGERVGSLTASDRVAVVKAMCFQQLAEKETAKAKYKALVTYIDALKAELNARQSQFRYLDNS